MTDTRHYNFADLFELAADKVPDRVALDRQAARGHLPRARRALDPARARACRPPGCRPGDHVGILATNCIEWVEAMFAIYKIRAARRERQLPLRRGGAALPVRQLRPGGARLPARVRPARRRGPRRAAEARSTSSASSGTAPTPTTRRSTRSSSRPRSRRARPSATSASAPTTTSTCSTPAAPPACPRA